jgi:hypothetical protein
MVSAPSRVVALSSDAHHYSYSGGVLDQPDLEAINKGTNAGLNLLFAAELSDVVADGGEEQG